ncbi:MAG TPA: hypothetical protein VMW16_16555 [Sedimentisphaerales bacterium]|nr:hypothetical protein [Sedimentisphaerales bacterium]
MSLVILVAAPGIFAEQVLSGEAAMAMLEHIALGYESHQRQGGELHIRGKLFQHQFAQEGYEIPDDQVMAPAWRTFEYFEKNGKRRYQEQQYGSENETGYSLDNNEKLVAFWPRSLRTYPLHNEDYKWSRLMGDYGECLVVKPKLGYENVATAMRSLIVESEAHKAGATHPWDITVTFEEGIYKIRVVFSKTGWETFWIDATKGYNLIKTTKYDDHPKILRDVTKQLQYVQDQTGRWVLSAADISGYSRRVGVVRKMELLQVEAGELNLPEELFELSSLDIPRGIYTEDHHFSPPLILNKGGTPDIDYLGPLLEANITTTQVAKIDGKGDIAIADHHAYIEHEAAKTEQHPRRPAAANQRQWQPFITWFVLVLLMGGIISVLIHYRLKRRGHP